MLPCFRAARLAQLREWRRWRDKLMTLHAASMKAEREENWSLYDYFGLAGKLLLAHEPPKLKRRKPRPTCMRPLRTGNNHA